MKINAYNRLRNVATTEEVLHKDRDFLRYVATIKRKLNLKETLNEPNRIALKGKLFNVSIAFDERRNEYDVILLGGDSSLRMSGYGTGRFKDFKTALSLAKNNYINSLAEGHMLLTRLDKEVTEYRNKMENAKEEHEKLSKAYSYAMLLVDA